MKLETRLFIADLSHLDCAWFDPQHGLVGETWRVDAELGGELDDEGMLCDFGIVKSVLKQALDADFDHRLLLDKQQARLLDQQAEQAHIALRCEDGDEYQYQAPEQSFALVDCRNINTLDLAAALQTQLHALLPDNISELILRLSPAHERGAYRYCHGLRQHAGNCQRMAHGHRAHMQIRVDGERQTSLEQHWQQAFDCRYIGSAEDLSTVGARHRYAYTGSQGQFELELPQQRSRPIDAQPTIEHITAYMSRQIAIDIPNKHIECQAFEGIGKGAISRCCAAD
ncbi:MAG: 6-pyruvoyl trahydropterin synthase family protein [Oceanococcus sp.]